jgi:hypothetical protein
MEEYNAFAQKYTIGFSGVCVKRKSETEPPMVITENDLHRINAITKFIQDNYKPKPGKISSYWLKHRVENEIKGYVSNGELMLCMLKAGYKPTGHHQPNLYFAVDAQFTYKQGYKVGKSVFEKKGILHSGPETMMDHEHQRIVEVRFPNECYMWKKGYEQAKQDCESKRMKCGKCQDGTCKSKYNTPTTFFSVE